MITVRKPEVRGLGLKWWDERGGVSGAMSNAREGDRYRN